MIRNLVFDLDGTLFDSLPSIERTARVAVSRALPEMSPPDLRSLVGPPIAKMFAKLWPDLPAPRMAALLAEFRTEYDSTGCLGAVPYEGMVSSLRRFHENGFRLFVLTNKPEKPTRAILAHHGILLLLTRVSCPDSVPPFSAKPLGAQALAVEFSLAPEETALVGDGADDAESARLCGFQFCYAAYGYGAIQAECFTRLDKFANLEQILLP